MDVLYCRLAIREWPNLGVAVASELMYLRAIVNLKSIKFACGSQENLDVSDM